MKETRILIKYMGHVLTPVPSIPVHGPEPLCGLRGRTGFNLSFGEAELEINKLITF